MTLKTDEELYDEFLKGNKKSFEEIVLRHRINMIHFILNYTKDISTAEDIVQDSFVYLLVNKDYYSNKYKLKTYLYMIAKCRAINFLKKNKQESEFIEDYLSLSNQDTITSRKIIDDIDNKEKLKKIILAMNNLKLHYREVIYLSDFQGMTIEEIGQIINKNKIQVSSLLYNARKSLRRLLKKDGIIYGE